LTILKAEDGSVLGRTLTEDNVENGEKQLNMEKKKIIIMLFLKHIFMGLQAAHEFLLRD
jgi:hypothetical protein